MNLSLNSVVIPDDLVLRRSPNPRDDLYEDPLINFDSRTIFYDVFILPSSSRLLAIGPPLLNLKASLYNMKLSANGRETRYRWQDLPDYKLSVLEADLPADGQWDIRMEFTGFSASFSLDGPEERHGRRVLAAISRNNRVKWISDWVDFYRANYALDDIVIYDNGSSNVGELKESLEGRAHVIDWGFPYGPPGKRFNKFAQPGALNHCLRKFAQGGVLFNFDIDELLVGDSSRLDHELQQHGTLYLESYNLPFVRPSCDDYSFYDFQHRGEPRRSSARKFICLADRVNVISQHNTWRYSGIGPFRRLIREKPEKHTSKYAEFLHFLGITTNWQPSLNKLKEVDPVILKKETRHIQMCP